MTTKLTKFIAATGPVARLQLHSDSCRVAVLLPQTTSLEVNHSITITSLEVKHNNNNTKPSPRSWQVILQVWNLHLVTRLHRFSLNPDASFLIWRKDILVVAPLYTGVVQVAQNCVFFGFNYEWRIG